MQLTKGPAMEGIDTVHAMLEMTAAAIPRLGVDAERCSAAVGGDLLATDEVYRRVLGGTPFRAAYRQVAAEITAGDAPPDLDPEAVLGSRRHLGGAGAPALDELESLAAQADAETAGRRRVFSDALSRLTAGEPT
jgi:argininosuccinate lyase